MGKRSQVAIGAISDNLSSTLQRGNVVKQHDQLVYSHALDDV
jgi:hypothetical protein